MKQTAANAENTTSEDCQSIRPDEEDVIISKEVMDTALAYGSIDALMEDVDAVICAETMICAVIALSSLVSLNIRLSFKNRLLFQSYLFNEVIICN